MLMQRQLLLYCIVILNGFWARSQHEHITFTADSITIKSYPYLKNIDVYKGIFLPNQIANQPKIVGQIKTKEEEIIFIPIVPFTKGEDYTIVYDNTAAHFNINIGNDYTYLTVENIFPSSKEVPANILKWYIQFSSPINEANVYNHIHFIGKDGDTIPRAVLPIENALLSDDKKMLTVWIEPGRQKRNLGPNLELGTVFKPNMEYILKVSKHLRDLNGVRMKHDFEKKFLVVDKDRIRPNTKKWNTLIPKKNTRSDLIISCNESLDYGSVSDNITVLDNENSAIKGSWLLTENERKIIFTPYKAWKNTVYTIRFSSVIEDLAGNNLHRLFDEEIKTNDVKNNTYPLYQTIEFEVD